MVTKKVSPSMDWHRCNLLSTQNLEMSMISMVMDQTTSKTTTKARTTSATVDIQELVVAAVVMVAFHVAMQRS
jgi:hypothetical protein